MSDSLWSESREKTGSVVTLHARLPRFVHGVSEGYLRGNHSHVGLLKLQGIILPVGRKIDLEQHILGDDLLAQALRAIVDVLQSVWGSDPGARTTVQKLAKAILYWIVEGKGRLIYA